VRLVRVYVDTDCPLVRARTMLNIQRAAPYAQRRARSENEATGLHGSPMLARAPLSVNPNVWFYPLSRYAAKSSSDKSGLSPANAITGILRVLLVQLGFRS